MEHSLRDVLYTARPVELFEGEALYSFLGRYLHATAAAEPFSFQRVAIGGHPLSISYDMPGRLNWLRTNLPPLKKFSLEDMVQRFTAAPMYRPFITEERWSELVDSLGNSRPRIGDDPEFKLGDKRRRPRHCRSCMQEQMRRYGLVFWPREFGLRLLEACPKHGVLLEALPCYSYFPLGFNRGFAIPSVPNGGYAVAANAAQIRFARLSVDLLHSGLASIPAELLMDVCDAQARNQGYVFYKRLDRVAFWKDASRFWAGLDRVKGNEDAKPPHWIRARKSTSPLFNILHIGFLFGSVPAWKRAVQAAQKAPPKPPPIMLKTVGLSRPVELQAVRASQLKGTNKVHLAKWERVLNGPPLACSKKFEPELKALLEQGLPIKEVVARSGIPHVTVYRRMKSNHAVTRRWIARALQREYEERFKEGKAAGKSGSARRAASLEGKRGWLYRHRRALLMVEELGIELKPPAPHTMGAKPAKTRRTSRAAKPLKR